MKGMVLGLSLVTLMVASGPVVAKEAKLALKLSAIERVTTTEEGGDELYFSITEYSSKMHPRHYVIPAFPTHWLSDHLNGVKDIVLWEKKLQDTEAVTVLVSLVESDVPPWNVDDLIGTVKLKAINNGEQIESQWRIPNKEYSEKLSGSENSFVLSGEGGEYHIALGLNADIPLKQQADERED